MRGDYRRLIEYQSNEYRELGMLWKHITDDEQRYWSWDSLLLIFVGTSVIFSSLYANTELADELGSGPGNNRAAGGERSQQGRTRRRAWKEMRRKRMSGMRDSITCRMFLSS